jgi:NAD(P)H-hydrate epimerase
MKMFLKRKYMKIFPADQIRLWDQYTIQHEPITSVELMDRASGVFTSWLINGYPDTGRPVCIAVGPGNNGGDGLAVARMLHRAFYDVKVWICTFDAQPSDDFKIQRAALPEDVALIEGVSEIEPEALIIDALFGSGLNRPLDGSRAEVIRMLNALPNEMVSIDLPSGLFADRHTTGPCIEADRTFSFETPKLAFFFPENAPRVGAWSFGSIGLSQDFSVHTDTPWHYMTPGEARSLVQVRPVFSHKGIYGHALLLAGSYGKMGAAVLAARACVRSGVGLLTVHGPRCGYEIIQTAVPEAMYLADPEQDFWSAAVEPSLYTAIGVGPGIGTAAATAQALAFLLKQTTRPMVLDADALNLLAVHPDWWQHVPENSILTPHPKEFERLFGPSSDDYARHDLLRNQAIRHRVCIVLKGAFSAVASPDGSVYFNSTGNPGMATGGSGDVLTGILTGLLAQGYAPCKACRLGVYLHGLAGDLAAAAESEPGMTAGDIVEYLGKAWKQLTGA